MLSGAWLRKQRLVSYNFMFLALGMICRPSVVCNACIVAKQYVCQKKQLEKVNRVARQSPCSTKSDPVQLPYFSQTAVLIAPQLGLLALRNVDKPPLRHHSYGQPIETDKHPIQPYHRRPPTDICSPQIRALTPKYSQTLSAQWVLIAG